MNVELFKYNRRLNPLVILSPVYNDWPSYAKLVREIKTVLTASGITHFKFVAADDHSSQGFALDEGLDFTNVDILTLANNLGHQKAICVGLVYISEAYANSDVIVMDSDGEDMPADIPAILRKSANTGDRIVFAQRTDRSEGRLFSIFYRIYKWIFRRLTGKSIDFGNFSFLPAAVVPRIVQVSEIWNHFSGGILKSKIPFDRLPLRRGTRYEGHSKMNFTSLVMHGLSAVSVYSDILAVRFLILSLISIFISFIGICVIAGIKIFTDYAIPGWASSVVLGLVILIFQAFLMGLFLTFTVLANRNQKNFIPKFDAASFIFEVHKL